MSEPEPSADQSHQKRTRESQTDESEQSLENTQSRQIRYKRSPESTEVSSIREPKWHESALRELRIAMNEVEVAFRHEANRLARNTDSSVVSDADVRAARRRLFISNTKTKRTIIARVASIIAVFYGGAIFPNLWKGADLPLVVVSLCLAIALLTLDEVLRNPRN
jgi:hypothetical protein